MFLKQTKKNNLFILFDNNFILISDNDNLVKNKRNNNNGKLSKIKINFSKDRKVLIDYIMKNHS